MDVHIGKNPAGGEGLILTDGEERQEALRISSRSIKDLMKDTGCVSAADTSM